MKLFMPRTEGQIMMILTNKENYISKISRQTNITYVTTALKCKRLSEVGLVTMVKEGRRMMIRLTEKGKEVKELLIRIEELTDEV